MVGELHGVSRSIWSEGLGGKDDGFDQSQKFISSLESHWGGVH